MEMRRRAKETPKRAFRECSKEEEGTKLAMWGDLFFLMLLIGLADDLSNPFGLELDSAYNSLN